MIAFYVRGQELRVSAPVIAADTLNYLTARFTFNADWNGLVKVASFSNGTDAAEIELTDDEIRAEDGLNLMAGEWSVGVIGFEAQGGEMVKRITSTVAKITVVPSTVEDGEPLPSLPSYGEQILAEVEDINDKLSSFTAEAETLAPGSDATALYDPETGVFSFGLPRGDKGDPGREGDPGDDGFSPTATVTKSGKTATITITDANGTTTATVSDGEDGDPGEDGVTPSFSIGTVETGEAGTDAAVTVTGTDAEPVLNFVIPKGDPGEVTEADLADALLDKADVIVDSASGAVASFPDGAAAPVVGLTVGVEPVQDLHGYDNPWPAGGGVNKFVTGDAIGCIASAAYGLSVTCDGTAETITISGTPNWTTTSPKSFRVISTRSGSYFGDAPVDHDYSGLSGKWFVASKSSNISNVDGVALLNTDGTIGIALTNTDLGDVSIVLKLVLYEGSTAPTSWTPYSNVCPITGHTAARVMRTGKNLFDPSNPESNGYYLQNGNYYSDSSYNCYIFRVKGGEYYTDSGNFAGIHTYWDGNKNFISGVNLGSALTHTFQVPANAVYMRVSISKTNIDGTQQLELGSTATSYAPYAGQVYDITFPTEAGTVYDGTLDAVSGVLTVEWVDISANKSFFGSAIPGNVGMDYRNAERNSEDWPTPYSMRIWNTARETQKCDRARIANCFSEANYGEYVAVVYNGDFGKTALRISEKLYQTLGDDDRIHMCYQIAEPFEIQLTPTEVETILGVNALFASCGDVDVRYRCDTRLFIEKKLAALVAQIVNS